MSVLRAQAPLRARWPLIDPWPLLAVSGGLAAGWLFVHRPGAVEFAAVLFLALPLLVSPRARILFLVIGTLTVFGPAELTTPKLVFLFGAGVALAGAFFRSRALVGTPAYSNVKPLLGASAGLLALVVVSFPVAYANGVAEKEWLRDVAPYVLFAWAPLFAFDAQTAFGTRGLRRLVAIVGLAGAAAFMTRWLANRGLTTSVSGEFGLPTFLLGAALFAFAIAMAIDGARARLRWLVLAALVLAMMATTGTRTSAVYLAAPLAIIVGTHRHFARRSVRVLAVLPLAAVLVGVGTYSLVKLFQADQDVITARFESLFQTGTTADQSYIARRSQADAAWTVFRAEPLFGAGPGHPIPWRDSHGIRSANPIVDTPLGFLADFGLVGALVVAFVVGSFLTVFRRLRRRTGERTTAQLGLIGFAAVILAYAFLQVPLEDKGLAAGLMLLLAMALKDASERAQRLPLDRARQ